MYSLSITLLHSLWQALLLLIIYKLFTITFRHSYPRSRKSLLYILILTQGLISSTVFCLLQFFPDSVNELPYSINGFLPAKIYAESYLVTVCMFVYTCGVLAKAIQLGIQWKNFKKSLLGTLVKAPVDTRLFVESTAARFGICRKIKIWYSSTVHSPITYGFLKPVILLPLAMMSNLSIAETEAVIIHELSHIQQKDYLYNWLVLAMETILFFNPFIFLLSRELKLEREKQCDQQVLNFSYPAWEYAQTLVNIASSKKIQPSFYLGVALRKSLLIKRIEFFSTTNHLRENRLSKNIFGALVIPMFFLLCLVAIKKSDKSPSSSDYAYSKTEVVPAKPVDDFLTDGAVSLMLEPVVDEVSSLPKPEIAEENKLLTVPEEKYNEIDNGYETGENTEPFYMTASSEEAQAKEVIIKQESNNGRKITISLSVENVNGKMIVKPVWSLSQITNITDSLKTLKDTIIKPFNVIQ